MATINVQLGSIDARAFNAYVYLTMITAQAGNHATAATWSGGVVPGDGDACIVNHTLSFAASATIGASLPAGYDAVTVNVDSGGSVTVNSGYKLTLRGDMGLYAALLDTGAALTGQSGSTVELDSSQAADAANQHYRIYWEDAPAQYHHIEFNGSSGARCTVLSNASGGNGYFWGTNTGAGGVRATYTDFSDIGTASLSAFRGRCSGSDWRMSFANCTFDGCGAIDCLTAIGTGVALNGTATFSLTDSTWTNSLDDYSVGDGSHGLATSAITTGTREITGCVFDKAVRLGSSYDFTINGNVFLNGFYGATTNPMAAFDNNMIADIDLLTLSTLGFGSGGAQDCYYLKREKATDDNPHFIKAYVATNTTIDGWIFEYEGDYSDLTDTGDGIQMQATSAATITVQNCIMLPSANADYMSAVLISLGGVDGNLTVAANHNTAYQKVLRMGEGYAGHAGMIASLKSNIAWHANTNPASRYKAQDQEGTVQDAMASSAATHNVGFNLATGSNLKGYDGFDFSSGSPGDSDVDEDPDFVDSSRDFASWDSYNGGNGTVANGLVEMAKLNDGDFDSSYTIANLLEYIRDGYRPQNRNLVDSGHDGVTRGAAGFAYAIDSSVELVTLQSLGTTITVAPDTTISASIGAVLLNGNSVSVAVNTPIVCDLGQVVIGSNAATLRLDRGVLVDSVGIVVSALTHDVSVTVAGGSFVWGDVATRPTVLGVGMINQNNRLWINEDNNVKLTGMRLDASGAYVNDATATFAVKNSTGGVHASISGITMTYSTGTDGNYIGVLSSSDAANLAADTEYIVEITASSSDNELFRRQRVVAAYHGFEDV